MNEYVSTSDRLKGYIAFTPINVKYMYPHLAPHTGTSTWDFTVEKVLLYFDKLISLLGTFLSKIVGGLNSSEELLIQFSFV